MLVYICAGLNEAQVNDSGPCRGGVGDSLSECRGGELIAGWAVGGGVSNATLLKFLTYCIPFQFTSEGLLAVDFTASITSRLCCTVCVVVELQTEC